MRAGVPGTTGVQWSQNRVSFSVKKSLSGKKKNTAQVQIYNLNAQSISLFQNSDTIVQLYAGYNVPKLLFQGNIVRGGATVEMSEATRICKLELSDGSRKLQRARLAVTFAAGVRLSQVLAKVTEETGLPTGVVDIEDDYVFENGLALNTTVDRAMDRLASIAGADWSVQDEKLQMLGTKNATSETVLKFTSKNGNLLRVARQDKGKVEVTTLIDGSMRPGRRFVVEDSPTLNGIFKCQDVSFKGDSGWDNDFVMKIVAKPWQDPATVAKANTTAHGFANDSGAIGYAEELYDTIRGKKGLFELFTDAKAYALSGDTGLTNLKVANPTGTKDSGGLGVFLIKFPTDQWGVWGSRLDANKARAADPRIVVFAGTGQLAP